VIAFPDPIFSTNVGIIYCTFTIHGGIFKEYASCGQQVFDVPTVVKRNEYSFFDSIIRAQLICSGILQQ
jgi:hypothetical protein